MSRGRTQRLAGVATERRINQVLLELLMDFWKSPNVHKYGLADSVSFDDVRQAYEALEAKYVLRLFSEFEAILRDYLIENHIVMETDENTASFLVDQTYRLHRSVLSPAPYQKVHRIRDARNRIAHRRDVSDLPKFPEAVSVLFRWLDKLPQE